MIIFRPGPPASLASSALFPSPSPSSGSPQVTKRTDSSSSRAGSTVAGKKRGAAPTIGRYFSPSGAKKGKVKAEQAAAGSSPGTGPGGVLAMSEAEQVRRAIAESLKDMA